MARTERATQEAPLFSVLTPVLNAASTLEESILSVVDQRFEAVEHWILDGGSTDGSREIAAKFSHLHVQNQADRSLYEALNRGAQMARGQWLIFLQADDWLAEGALEAWAGGIAANPAAQVVTGSVEFVRLRGGNLVSGRDWEVVKKYTLDSEKRLEVEQVVLGEPMLNGRAIRREFFLRMGGFDLRWRLAADREFLLRAAMAEPASAVMDALVYRYRWHAGSRTLTDFSPHSSVLTEENLEIAEVHLARRLQGRVREVLRRWHTAEAVRAFLTSLERGDVPSAVRYGLRGLGRDAGWVWSLLAEVGRCLPGYVGRGFRTRAQIAREGG